MMGTIEKLQAELDTATRMRVKAQKDRAEAEEKLCAFDAAISGIKTRLEKLQSESQPAIYPKAMELKTKIELLRVEKCLLLDALEQIAALEPEMPIPTGESCRSLASRVLLRLDEARLESNIQRRIEKLRLGPGAESTVRDFAARQGRLVHVVDGVEFPSDLSIDFVQKPKKEIHDTAERGTIDALTSQWIPAVQRLAGRRAGDVQIQQTYREVNGEKRLVLLLFTARHRYRITAIERDQDAGYLGATVSRRVFPLREDHVRWDDLHVGELTHRDWQLLLGDIVSYEMTAAP